MSDICDVVIIKREAYRLLSLKSYLKNPCGTLSIPYWKQKKTAIPDNMKIIHEKDYIKGTLDDYNDEPYFRLYHDMKNIDLWILLKEKNSGAAVAGGIADYDRECGELILEWIQVIPTYRGRGYGKTVVNSLLSKMQGIAEFATVSGKVNNPANPEGLYRRCGFSGDDVWHILTKKG